MLFGLRRRTRRAAAGGQDWRQWRAAGAPVLTARGEDVPGGNLRSEGFEGGFEGGERQAGDGGQMLEAAEDGREDVDLRRGAALVPGGGEANGVRGPAEAAQLAHEGDRFGG